MQKLLVTEVCPKTHEEKTTTRFVVYGYSYNQGDEGYIQLNAIMEDVETTKAFYNYLNVLTKDKTIVQGMKAIKQAFNMPLVLAKHVYADVYTADQ